MSATAISTIKRWQGLSTDDKPIANTPEGSTFHEVDTGAEYVFFNGTWEEDLRKIYALRMA